MQQLALEVKQNNQTQNKQPKLWVPFVISIYMYKPDYVTVKSNTKNVLRIGILGVGQLPWGTSNSFSLVLVPLFPKVSQVHGSEHCKCSYIGY